MPADKRTRLEVGSRVARRTFPMGHRMFLGRGQPKEGWTYTVAEVVEQPRLTLIRLEGLPKTRNGKPNLFNAALFRRVCGRPDPR